MYLKRSSTVKYFAAAIIGCLLYSEWLIYSMQAWYWRTLECVEYDSSCIKILFVADPQIQGDIAVPAPFSYPINWDSDRYLKSTFRVVIQHFRPDVIVYMGDLMDEGSISTLKQYHSYVKRLSDIFEVDYPIVQIWIPGDNDIGGENEPIKKDKIEEFNEVYQQPETVTFRNITFYKANGITNSFPKKLKGNGNEYRIVVSHYPITYRHAFGHEVNNEINPDIYFCAHEHEAKYVRQSRKLTNRDSHMLTSESAVLNVSTKDDHLYEIYVPTCSYRMGTDQIGYGAAILENNNQNLRYTVFWSSRRFPYLFIYLVTFIILQIYFVIYCAAWVSYRKPTMNWATDKVPLLDRV
ncbi:uncharacterized protein LOC101740054 isoform X1 [Bombyx mori]|uniref:Calcineurin-like phosphoesterase domain-containing protein n=2 Tax=Bombyx mori TaxID=7091 RepID=A0A8R2AQ78_BOMMO|nr:uncharacterized protein C630.12 isoform X1 [Bombyx mori]